MPEPPLASMELQPCVPTEDELRKKKYIESMTIKLNESIKEYYYLNRHKRKVGDPGDDFLNLLFGR
jgi:hypothetical protein